MEAYLARYVFPISSPPIRDSYVTVDNGVIVAVSNERPTAPVIDLGNAAIVPGLINAHTHLELSGFDQPIGQPNQGFAAWIRDVVSWRRELVERHSEAELWDIRGSAVQRGLAECAAAGVTSIADIVSPGWEPLAASVPANIRLFPFQETLGLPTNRIDALHAQAEAFTRQTVRGVSPHAPYTVGIELLEKVVRLSAERKFPVAMHLAESPEELELLRSHSGAFYSLLNDLGAWDPSAIPRGIDILDYLHILAKADHALIIHGNYLHDDELAYLAQHREKFTVVYCPRTHAYFQHPRYPLPALLARGICVAIGTDSRASNPDLNLWDELRFVADHFPELSLATILSLGTQSAAHLFARPDGLVGHKHADMVIIGLPDDEVNDPHELLFDAAARVYP